MNKVLLINYLNKLKKEDIYNYALTNQITLNNNELDIIYDYIKNRYNDIINNPVDILNEIKNKIDNKTYLLILNLYNKYQDKLLLFK